MCRQYASLAAIATRHSTTPSAPAMRAPGNAQNVAIAARHAAPLDRASTSSTGGTKLLYHCRTGFSDA